MTALQEQAINLIKEAPDDKVTYVISFLNNKISRNEKERLARSRAAYNDLMTLCRKGTNAVDYKEDLAKALDEKYESID